MTQNYRDAYYPGTEELGPNEMRVTALGTGMPNLRPSQMSASWFVELGNGDKFLFDLGTGGISRFVALGVPYVEANKLFLTHLHTDHMGDFMAWYVGGWIERQTGGGVEVWGPSGQTPELGTQYCIEKIIEACNWDITSRTGRLPEEGKEITIHEFDYRGENEIVYQQNGVTVRSWPAIHAIDGCISYGLEWNGLKFVYGGDTEPNEYFLEYAKDADLSIHECFITVDLLMEKFGFPRDLAINVGTRVHTSPQAWANVMAETRPRMAIAYHFYRDLETAPSVFSEIRKVYDGPISLAKDLMVWNVTSEKITVRQAVYNEDTWPPHGSSRREDTKGTRGKLTPMSDWLKAKAVHFEGVDEYEDAIGSE